MVKASVIITSNREEQPTLKSIQDWRGNLEIIIAKEKNLGFARNEGIRKASGDTLIFFDDDLIIKPQLWSLIMKLPPNTFLMSKESTPPEPPEPSTRIFVIHRGDLLKVGGFNGRIRFSGEDRDIWGRCVKAGLNCIFLRGFCVHLTHPLRSQIDRKVAIMSGWEQAKVLLRLGRLINSYGQSFWGWFFRFWRFKYSLRLVSAFGLWTFIRNMSFTIQLWLLVIC